MFAGDSKPGSVILPSLYLLFAQPDLPIVRVFLKEGVEKFIFNGADLMFPGIKSVYPNLEAFKLYDVCVVYAKNTELVQKVAQAQKKAEEEEEESKGEQPENEDAEEEDESSDPQN